MGPAVITLILQQEGTFVFDQSDIIQTRRRVGWELTEGVGVETKPVVIGLGYPSPRKHTLALALSWRHISVDDVPAPSDYVNIRMHFWHEDDNTTINVDDRDPNLTVSLRSGKDVVGRMFWCHCGLGVEANVFPSWQDIWEYDQVQLSLDVVVVYRSEYDDNRINCF